MREIFHARMIENAEYVQRFSSIIQNEAMLWANSEVVLEGQLLSKE